MSYITIRVPRDTIYVNSIPYTIAARTGKDTVKIDIDYIVKDARLSQRSLRKVEQYFNNVYNGNPESVRLTPKEVTVVDRVLENLHL